MTEFSFDLTIADEAHNCTGRVETYFGNILDDKKIRTNILESDIQAIQNYTQNKIIIDVAEKFHGIKCDVTKASYEVKERGDNPETGELKDRKDDTIFYHFDRPFKVLKTFLIFEDIEDNK